ncbi:MAG: hypothetical protein DI529_11745 [Chryseobacterium sp.]|nr:MAG: hypothetical protein DI529_11745 [Chryseobacterium sp.]
MKKLILFLQFPILVLSQQKIKIVDSETSKPISSVRLISNQNIYYSNDDGYILLPENTDNWEISAFGYISENIKTHSETIFLKPKYQEIDEVKIVSIDFTKILKSVARKYDKIYYDKPQVFEMTIKQRAFENNQMKLLMVADGKFWSRDGNYNAKEAYNGKLNDFIQIQIEHLRYLKSEPYGNFIKTKKQDTSQDSVGDMFLSYEINRTLGLSNITHTKNSGKLLYDDGEEQEISFLIKNDRNMIYKGNILYNKKDNAITHFELDFEQSQSERRKLEDQDGAKYERQLGDGKIFFDYYKSGDKYVPSRMGFTTEKFKTITEKGEFEYRAAREIIFKNFKPAEKTQLKNPVNISTAYWTKMTVTEDKGETLLTKEEEQFINEKSE